MTTPRSRTRSRRAALGALAVAALLLAACGDDGDASDVTAPADAGTDDGNGDVDGGDDSAAAEQPVVVASTSWVAAFALAAGVDDVTVVAPVDLQHPPDHDPRPSDLAAVAEADYVLLAGFEGFAERLTDATGSDAELVTVTAENTPENIRTQVLDLAETFGTTEAAEAWIERFDARIEELQADLDAARPDTAPTAAAHVFMAYWADFAGIELVGTYGPAPVSATELAELTAAEPDLLLANAHVPAGGAFDDLGAEQVDIVNFPGESLDLLWVFETNAQRLLDAFAEL